MSKPIKVSEETYGRLVALMHPRETFDGVVSRLVDTREATSRLLDSLEGGARFQEGKPDGSRLPDPKG